MHKKDKVFFACYFLNYLYLVFSINSYLIFLFFFRLTCSTPFNKPIKPTFDESSIQKVNSIVDESKVVVLGSLKKPNVVAGRNATPAFSGLKSRLKTPGMSSKKKDEVLNNSTRLSMSAQNASVNRLSKPKVAIATGDNAKSGNRFYHNYYYMFYSKLFESNFSIIKYSSF